MKKDNHYFGWGLTAVCVAALLALVMAMTLAPAAGASGAVAARCPVCYIGAIVPAHAGVGAVLVVGKDVIVVGFVHRRLNELGLSQGAAGASGAVAARCPVCGQSGYCTMTVVKAANCHETGVERYVCTRSGCNSALLVIDGGGQGVLAAAGHLDALVEPQAVDGIHNVTFQPGKTAGEFMASFTAFDTAGKSYAGVLTITVQQYAGDISADHPSPSPSRRSASRVVTTAPAVTSSSTWTVMLPPLTPPGRATPVC